MRFFFVIAFAIFSWTTLFAQKSPYHIRNYKPTEYGGYMQTWQILQDSRGIIFLASTSNIFTYDGQSWDRIPVKTGAATRQVFYDSTSDVVYVGSVGDFGCVEQDSFGKYYYHSFLDQLKPEESVFTDIWKVQQQGNKIYFQSAEYIFIVENKKVIGRIDAQKGSTFALMFNCQNRIFVRQRGVGLMEINGTSMSLVANSEMFATTRLMGMIPIDGDFYLLTGDQGFVRMSGVATPQPVFEFFPVANDTFLLQKEVLGIEWINSEEFAVSSRYGMMIYGRDFKPRLLFNKAAGLLDESISEFYVDREKNIWMAHNQGCSMISYSTPFLFYGEDYGFGGTLETMNFTNDTLYIGSSTGLYMSTTASQGGMYFSKLPGIPNEAWDIIVDGPYVIVSSTTGIYDLKGNTSTTQLTNRYTNCGVWIDTGKVLLAAEKGGFTILSVDEKRQWREEQHFELNGIELIRIGAPEATANPGEYRFFATTRFKSGVIVDFNYTDSALHVRELLPENGLPANDCFPVKFHDTTYFLGYLTAYCYYPERDLNDSSVCVEMTQHIFDRIYNGEAEFLSGHIDCKLFLEQPWTDPTTSFFGIRNGKIELRKIMLGNVFSTSNIQFGSVQAPNTVWLLNQQSLIKYDLNFKLDTSAPYAALITRVHFAGDSLEYYYPDQMIEVPYAKNSVAFRFAAPYFKYDKSSVYRYMLIGYDTGWSVPGQKPEKEYTNLHEGTYTFVVQAANPYHVASSEARFTFTVLPPWYRSMWAYTLYIIAFVLFVFGAIRISAHRLRRQKEKLELIVQERTAEVVEQKHQIEKQKVDLEEAYTGIQDSIVYSQRIQNAILPTNEEIQRIVPDSFVLFFPRDIVSGDFYWFAEKNALKFIACVDCTGHGVPGALMSMIGNTILNQIIIEKNITSPDEILNRLHKGVRQALKQDAGGDTRDGMDLALIAIDKDNTQLKYAGANRNLWIIRNRELLETKADKFPIAGSQQEEERKFTAHTVPLEKGDVIYLTTDGYADQFGGPKGKKFMVRQFIRVLLEIHGLPMSEQKVRLEKAFFDWKRNHEQVDDVLVIGIRIQ